MMDTNVTDKDRTRLHECIELALEAERVGNLPIGAIISIGEEVIAKGKNSIWMPEFNANRHAEIETLRAVPPEFWNRSRDMTLYTTLEPCLMCLGALLLFRVGRVVYGASDDYGGAVCVIGHMPPYFETRLLSTQWIGPALPEECDELSARARALVAAHAADV
jgi:tRNA(adenine34) deaminase